MTTVQGYSVLITAQNDGTGDLTEEAGLAFATAVAGYHGVAAWGGEPEGWEARAIVDTYSALDAATEARNIVTEAAPAAVAAREVSRANFVREDLLETADLGRWPELVSGPEVGEILDVSARRVHQLATDNKYFPRAADHLRYGKIRIRAAITTFAKRDWRPGNRFANRDVAS